LNGEKPIVTLPLPLAGAVLLAALVLGVVPELAVELVPELHAASAINSANDPGTAAARHIRYLRILFTFALSSESRSGGV
jgi:hypothetical protein